MSEKLYALLLGLYPAQFRKAYGAEALQLFRDRLRDERGFFPRLRLWLDLLVDVAVSLPREHRALQPAMGIAAASDRSRTAIPSFGSLDRQPPRAAAVVLASALALIGVGAFFALLSYAGIPPNSRLSVLAHRAREERAQSRLQNPPPTPARSAARATTAPAVRKAIPVAATTRGTPVLVSGAPLARIQPADHAKGAVPLPTVEVLPGSLVAAAERHRVVAGAAKDLRASYFDSNVAQTTADALLAHEKHGDDNGATTGPLFAHLLTAQMHDASHDLHLVVEYSQNSLPNGPPPQTPESLARYRAAMEQQHCMIRSAALLPHNIGYLKLDFFPDPSVCAPAATAAMSAVNHADAVIFDLRDNSGGFPAMVSLIASWLFDHPVYMYGPRAAPTEQSWTHSPVPGSLLADKPVYILTSASTWSGAEQFSYDLKMLKRATLVGDTTRGGAHAGVFHRIDEHFGIGIPDVRPVNPYSDHDWEGVGVQPDVPVHAADTLATAEKLAEHQLRHR